jgi:hypothetical protein
LTGLFLINGQAISLTRRAIFTVPDLIRTTATFTNLRKAPMAVGRKTSSTRFPTSSTARARPGA